MEAVRWMCAMVGAGAAAAAAQVQVTPGSVHFSLEWTRIDVATNAIIGPGMQLDYLSPGQAARFEVRMQYTPGVGAPVTYPPSIAPGSSGTGTIAGFWSGGVDIFGSALTEGTWSGTGTSVPLQVRRRLLAPFHAPGETGAGEAMFGGSRMANILPAQFAPSAAMVSPLNDVLVWQGTWTPFSYQPFFTFSIGPNSLGFWTAQLAVADSNSGFTFPIPGNVEYTFGAPIVFIPAPGMVGSIVAAGVAVSRRRRRTTEVIGSF